MLTLPDKGCRDILREYYKLAVRSELSELEAERMVQILELAEQDDTLSFWLNEIDYLLCQELNLLDEHNIGLYEDQQAKWREYLDTLDDNVTKVDEVLQQRIKILSQKLQQRLRSRGYYDGLIDGNVGPRTRKAIKVFQEDHNISAHGFLSPNTLTVLEVR